MLDRVQTAVLIVLRRILFVNPPVGLTTTAHSDVLVNIVSWAFIRGSIFNEPSTISYNSVYVEGPDALVAARRTERKV